MSHASVYVLDISVLLNTPDSLYEFPEQEIVLPVSILDALDTLRQDLGEKGRAANLVSKMLDECSQLGNLVEGFTNQLFPINQAIKEQKEYCISNS